MYMYTCMFMHVHVHTYVARGGRGTLQAKTRHTKTIKQITMHINNQYIKHTMTTNKETPTTTTATAGGRGALRGPHRRGRGLQELLPYYADL